MEKWYKPLLEKVNNSYRNWIIVIDMAGFSLKEDVIQALAADFALHHYEGELKLRSFLTKNKGRRVIIFKNSRSGYIPYDVEENAEIIKWSLEDVPVFYNLPTATEDKEIIREVFLPEINNIENKIKDLLKKQAIPWRDVAALWGKLSCLRDENRYALKSEDAFKEKTFKTLEKIIEEKFCDFIKNDYNNLFFDSFLSGPPTIDKIMHYLINQEEEKKALICLDCMGFQEWYCVKNYLEDKGVKNFKEKATFALLPTLTGISRKALFTGEKLVTKKIKEDEGFLDFIRRNSAPRMGKKVYFFANKDPKLTLDYFDYDICGIVFNFIDDTAHKAQVVKGGKMLMQNNLKIILREEQLAEIITRFIEREYKVYIASDHGSIWCHGMGVEPKKHLVDDKAKRVAIYPNEKLAQEFMQESENLILYKNKEILAESVAVFPIGRNMYANEKESGITHGGHHLEEVVVPFVEVLG
ncbi:MAG: PglZ domain-containing protein [Bacillota bacterium]